MPNKHIIYVDVNHIIELAKDKKNGRHDRLNAIRTLREGGMLFPFSSTHLMEFAAIGKPEQRQDISQIVKDISTAFVFAPFFETQYFEILDLVSNHFLKKHIRFEHRIIRKGYLSCMGEYTLEYTLEYPPDISKEEQDEMNRVYEKELDKVDFIEFLLTMYHGKMVNGSSDYDLINKSISNDRENYKKNHYASFADFQKIYLFENLKKRFILQVFEAIKELEIDKKMLEANTISSFFNPDSASQVPFFDIYNSLLLELYIKDLNRPIKSNHIYDIMHLSVALPYSGHIITDKEMVDTCTKSGLGAKYKAAIYTSIDDFLAAVGT